MSSSAPRSSFSVLTEVAKSVSTSPNNSPSSSPGASFSSSSTPSPPKSTATKRKRPEPPSTVSAVAASSASASSATATATTATRIFRDVAPPVKRRKTKWQKPASQPIMRAAVWEILYGRARIVETALRYGIPLRTLRRYRDISKAGGTGYEEVDGKGVQFKPFIDENGDVKDPLPPRMVKKYRTGFKGTRFEEDLLDANAPDQEDPPPRGREMTQAALAKDAANTKRRKPASKKSRRPEAKEQELTPEERFAQAEKQYIEALKLIRRKHAGAPAFPQNNMIPPMGQQYPPMMPSQHPAAMYPQMMMGQMMYPPMMQAQMQPGMGYPSHYPQQQVPQMMPFPVQNGFMMPTAGMHMAKLSPTAHANKTPIQNHSQIPFAPATRI